VSLGADPPKWAPKRIAVVDGEPGIVLSASRIKKHRIGSRLFSELSKDAVFQQYYGVRFNPYLTDSVLEAEFLNRVYPRNDLSEGMHRLLSALGGSVPILSDLPLRRI
jgi:hypothetical protein